MSLDGSQKPNRSTPMLRPLLKGGKLVGKIEGVEEIRTRVRSDLDQLAASVPSLQWR